MNMIVNLLVVGVEVLTAVNMKSTVSWDVTLASCWFSAWFTLNTEAAGSFKVLGNFYQTIWHYNAEDGIPQPSGSAKEVNF
jgi:hypothetical protein